MKRADWIFAVGAVVVIAFFIWLSRTGHKPTPLSAIPAHQAATTRQQCLACHDPALSQIVKPIPKSHPQAWKDERFKCTVCHLQSQ